MLNLEGQGVAKVKHSNGYVDSEDQQNEIVILRRRLADTDQELKEKDRLLAEKDTQVASLRAELAAWKQRFETESSWRLNCFYY